MAVIEAAQSVPDTSRDSLAQSLAVAAHGPVAASEPGRAPEFVEQRQPFPLEELGPARVTANRCPVELSVEVIEPAPVGHLGRGIEGRRGVGTHEAICCQTGGGNVDSRVGEQRVQIPESLRVRKPNFDTIEQKGPNVAVSSEHVGGACHRCERLEPLTRGLWEIGKHVPAATYLRSIEVLQRYARRVAGFFASCDVFLTPTVSAPPLPLGQMVSTDDEPFRALEASGPSVAYSGVIANLTGNPAMSVPLHWNDDDLPIGMHFLGRFADETTCYVSPDSSRKPAHGISAGRQPSR